MNYTKHLILSIGVLAFFYLWNNQNSVSITISGMPQNTPLNDTLFLATNLNQWQPNASDYYFRKQEDGNYTIKLQNINAPFEYKITRGSWENVECTSQGTDIENRKANHKDKSIQIEVKGWKDLFGKKSTKLPNVQVMDDDFPMPQFNTTRRIWIYLPTDYATSTEKYPVLYMHDGQNLFDALTSYSGEWEVDETMQKLEQEGTLKLIIVGIENGGKTRSDEYTPWKNKEYGGGEGAAYGEFIVNDLKPFIDKHYRTKSDRHNTGIMGSSLGGLISMYIGMEYSETFGKLGVFSPSFWWSTEAVNQVKNKGFVDTKIYMNAGLDEHKWITKGTKEMERNFRKLGYTNENLVTKYIKGGTHTERFWRSEFENAVLWLFK